MKPSLGKLFLDLHLSLRRPIFQGAHVLVVSDLAQMVKVHAEP